METDCAKCNILTCPYYNELMEYSCSLGENEVFFESCQRKNGRITHNVSMVAGGFFGVGQKAISDFVERAKKHLDETKYFWPEELEWVCKQLDEVAREMGEKT